MNRKSINRVLDCFDEEQGEYGVEIILRTGQTIRGDIHACQEELIGIDPYKPGSFARDEKMPKIMIDIAHIVAIGLIPLK